MAELYSVTGVFCEAFPGISPWGGFFIRGREGNTEHEIIGQLVDLYGPSRLEGIMEDDLLKFRKQYERCNMELVFDYEFILENGIWRGEFSSSDGYKGASLCKTSLFLENIEAERMDLRTPEGYFKAVINSMVDNGQLERYNDPKTGEEMIRARKL